MARLLPTALAIAIVTGGSASHAGVILTAEDMDLVTAGLTFDSLSMSEGTGLSSATSIIMGDTTLLSQCAGNTCAVTVTTQAGYANTCSSCTLTLDKSGITVADTSGHVWYSWTGMPHDYPAIMSAIPPAITITPAITILKTIVGP